jgi:hypothetical protein
MTFIDTDAVVHFASIISVRRARLIDLHQTTAARRQQRMDGDLKCIGMEEAGGPSDRFVARDKRRCPSPWDQRAQWETRLRRDSRPGNFHAVTGMQTYEGQHNESTRQGKDAEKYEAV